LAFEITRTADELWLAVTGELDMATGPSLEEVALPLLRERPAWLLLDLTHVTFCDSSGIACLIHIQKAAVEAGVQLQLRNVHGLVRRVLDLAGVSEILGVRDDPGNPPQVATSPPPGTVPNVPAEPPVDPPEAQG
jgi:anti-sigma B factor antagonist